ncbi:hypothetical protein [Kutzneria buriramensis]|uniref:Secreted protein n=1 Tax=Kutzneria buriramensis TaxID=1045776 RepID=A0A3E0I9S4_9PSEU|nr:hypothetical protein [Kutzneria buriramensis]REH55389.1 hypothetical protein BCF44_101409 [Kutzneria buriramensis]
MRKTPLYAALLVTAATVLPLSLSAPAQAATTTWTADLASHNEDNSNIANADGVVRLAGGPAHAATDQLNLENGIIMFDPRQLPAKANTVAAALDGAVPADSELAVDVRGLKADGQWTEWTEATSDAPAVLPEASATVQVRMMLTAPYGSTGPVAHKLTLSASTSMAPAVAPHAARSYKVYATREGLVGSTTANGHKIVSHDHFVALPSGKSLNPNGKKTYQVKVCAANGRCETAPVWDVGPWNTKDDYWNPSSTRQEWKTLPEGKPEAQAAYQSGYNGGKDQFGRKVSNPAGIDLADGTFLDGLRLTDNAWVTVTYLWT